MLLHSVSNYVPRMGLSASPCDDVSFASKGGIACVTIACANWPPASLQQIGDTVYIPTYLSIDTVMAANLDSNLLGPFTSKDANVEPLHVRKTV